MIYDFLLEHRMVLLKLSLAALMDVLVPINIAYTYVFRWSDMGDDLFRSIAR